MQDELNKDSTIEELQAENNLQSIEFQNDPEVDRLVDQIVNEESDVVLSVQDASKKADEEKHNKKPKFRQRIRSFFVSWWHNKLARNLTLAILFIFFVLTLIIPVSRYGLLNLFGVRVQASMVLYDNKTGLELENIEVSIQGTSQTTDENGTATFSNLKLGNSTIKIDRLGYAKVERKITLGFGSNPLGEVRLDAIGEQFTFKVVDWLSMQPIKTAEASSGQDIAKSNDEGSITLTVGEILDETTVTLKAEGYREEVYSVNELKQENNVFLVSSKKHVFVSNRNGQYDVYSIDIDAKNEKLLIEATGHEREAPYVLSHPTENQFALISSRDNEVNKSKFILDGLFVVDSITGEYKKITRSEQIEIIGWEGNKLVYVAVDEGVSGGSAERSKLWSYDTDTQEKIQIANSNYFNDVKLIEGRIYYAVSSYATAQSLAKLFSVKADNTDLKKIVDAQVWSIARTSYDTLLFNADGRKWYEQSLGKDAVQLEREPSNTLNRIYNSSPDRLKSAWVDTRDGKGVLLVYDNVTKKNETILTKSGLTNPAYWVDNNTLVFRVMINGESADYVMTITDLKKEPLKIADVTANTSRYFY